MKLSKTLARSIHVALSSVLDERAHFLSRLYADVSSGPTMKQRYVDVGAGKLANTRVLGRDFQEVYALDVRPPDGQGHGQVVHFIKGSAQALPLKADTADLVTMLSVIEHLPDPQKALAQAAKLLRPGGELVIQAPNPLFPVDLHTGLPNPFFIPRFARRALLSALGHKGWLDNVHSHPREKDMTRWLGATMRLTGVRKVVYPSHFVPGRVRPVYALLAKARFFNLVPLSYLYVYKVVR